MPVNNHKVASESSRQDSSGKPNRAPVFHESHDHLQIDLTDATAQATRKAGLLTSKALERLLKDALERQRAGDALLTIADRTAAADVPPMPMDEINAEVKAARAERRRRADRR